MEDNQQRFPIFCTAEIPPKTVERFLEATELGAPSFFDIRPFEPSDYLALVTSRDLSTIHQGLSSPVQTFTRPFIDMSIDEVAAWFDANITQPDARGYNPCMFIVLKEEAAEYEVCTLAWTFSGHVETLRCDFEMALQVAVLIDVDTEPEGTVGCFHRIGVVITGDNFKLALNGGMYLDGMEVKIDEAWRDFGNW